MMIKLKGILKENSVLGILPSSKLMKMKWNPLTEAEPMNEEYVETIDGDGDIDAGMSLVSDAWKRWKQGPMTEPQHVKPAKKELINYIVKWLNKELK
tara:strand:- start:561 stop:851 length:291 start_codon:yes stop_codon:yes gene_type:complete